MIGHVVVTGANRGIGLALCRRAVADGARVTAVVRDPSRADALGGLDGVAVVAGDVADPAAMARAAEAVEAVVDLLVCNAGRYVGRGRIGEEGYDAEAWRDVLTTNVAGVYFTVEAFLPHLRRGAPGRVAVISSQMGVTARAPGGSYIYRASKAAATNLARNLAADLAAEGIAVGAYHPGWVSTDMGGAGAPVDAEGSAAGLWERFARLTPERSGVFEDHRGETLDF